MDPDGPAFSGYRQIADAHLITLARRRSATVVTFDPDSHELAGGRDIELLPAS